MSLRNGKIKVGTVVYKGVNICVKSSYHPSGFNVVGKAIIELVVLEEGLVPTRHRRGTIHDWEEGFRKCRVPKAYVSKITRFMRDKSIDISTTHAVSSGPNYLEYREGEIVVPDSFDTDPKRICTHGIHVFLDCDSAKRWIGWDYTV